MKRSRNLGSALIVVGGSIAATPLMALELGDITVHSTLGQPLRASIAYALSPNESITDTCVSLQPVHAGGAPTIGSASLNVADGLIAITRGPVIREPLVSFRVRIRCPYTPRLSRDYTLFIDPPAAIARSAEVSQPQRPASTITAGSRAAPLRRPASREPIATGSRYLVERGDSLSLIAQRAATGQLSWRDLSSAIFRANPDAFVGNDPNRLKAGSWLSIPDGATIPARETASSAPSAASLREQPAVASTVYAPQIVRETAADAKPELLEEIPPPLALQPRTELRPGDLILDTAIPTPAASAETADSAATTAAESTSILQQPASRGAQSSNGWLWLGGGVIAVFLGLVLVGRRFFGRFGSTPVSPAPLEPLDSESDTQRVEALHDVEVDFGTGPLIEDDSPTAENPQLDADLVAGTGLSESSDVDDAANFAFAATTGVDIELTEAMSADWEEPETDIIPPIHAEQSGILEEEVLPEDEDYDISVVLDATKMPDPADVTETDLEAIAVNDDDDDTLISDDYTVSQEVDYKILEQDYQDEMTATEALNAEIQKAAEDIAATLDAAGAHYDITDTDAHTAVQELDITARLPANDDGSIADNDDTGINPGLDTDAADDSSDMPEKDQKAG